MKITIIGAGNVGTHLARALSPHADVTLVPSRTLQGLPPDSDLLLLCVKDGAIAETARKAADRARIIAHTSGSVPLEVLEGCAPATGVLYPMQTFTKGVALDYSTIPVFTEASDTAAEKALEETARLFTSNVAHADGRARKRLHLAAVFACNFTNALCSMAETVLRPSGLDIQAMLPLLRQTVDKLESVSPRDAQTGPASRGDTAVMQAHLEMLARTPDLREIYRLMSRYIEKQKHE